MDTVTANNTLMTPNTLMLSQNTSFKGILAPSAVWTVEDIRLHCRLSKNAANALVKQPSFPRPLGNQFRNRVWLSEEVKAYFKDASKAVKRSPNRAAIDIHHVPMQMALKGSK